MPHFDYDVLRHVVADAIANPRRVTIEYADADGVVTTRAIIPLHFVGNRTSIDLALQAWCYAAQEERRFRLDRIMDWSGGTVPSPEPARVAEAPVRPSPVAVAPDFVPPRRDRSATALALAVCLVLAIMTAVVWLNVTTSSYRKAQLAHWFGLSAIEADYRVLALDEAMRCDVYRERYDRDTGHCVAKP